MRAVPLARKKAKNLLQMFGWNLWQGLDRNITHIWSKKKVAKTHSCDPNELIVSHHDIEVIGRCLVLQKRDFYDYGATYVVWTGAGYVIKKRVDKHHAPCAWQPKSKRHQSVRTDQSD
jgi:hypothetical protein